MMEKDDKALVIPKAGKYIVILRYREAPISIRVIFI
jgi:hypothetical protein